MGGIRANGTTKARKAKVAKEESEVKEEATELIESVGLNWANDDEDGYTRIYADELVLWLRELRAREIDILMTMQLRIQRATNMVVMEDDKTPMPLDEIQALTRMSKRTFQKYLQSLNAKRLIHVVTVRSGRLIRQVAYVSPFIATRGTNIITPFTTDMFMDYRIRALCGLTWNEYLKAQKEDGK